MIFPTGRSVPAGLDWMSATGQEALRRSHFTIFFRQVICPTGSVREFLSSPRAKNISLNPSGKSLL